MIEESTGSEDDYIPYLMWRLGEKVRRQSRGDGKLEGPRLWVEFVVCGMWEAYIAFLFRVLYHPVFLIDPLLSQVALESTFRFGK